jgi:transcriptional regulator with GAF, ATPase, and Fis domain
MSNLLQFQRAIDFQKKLDAQKLELEEELRHLRGQSHLVGANDGLKTIKDHVKQLKDSEAPVLITGVTGTGKEIIADTIQSISPRRNAPFVKVNCGAIPEPLVDSELFGYVKGAFTGAVANRAGRFEQASGGTIFLDEVGELPLQIQVRLLRVLQNHVVERLGSNVPIPVDVRLIAATNRNLETMLRNGTFREDLYYRLNVFPIRIPPLRDRAEDIPALACHFLEKICARMNRPDIPSIRPESFKRLMAYTWPGNVRELENLFERTLILDSGAEISPELQLPQDPGWYMNTEDSNGQDAFTNMIAELVTKEMDSRLSGLKAQNPKSRVDFKTLDALMADHIKAALLLCGGKIHGKGGAGVLLGVNPYTLRKKMEKLGFITKNQQTASA